MPGLKLPRRKVYLFAPDLYAQHPIDFEDVLIVAQISHANINSLFSYYRGFARVGQIQG